MSENVGRRAGTNQAEGRTFEDQIADQSWTRKGRPAFQLQRHYGLWLVRQIW